MIYYWFTYVNSTGIVKVFTSSEATAMYELQVHEKCRRENFEINKDTFLASRNPLTGEQTPRVWEEQLIMEAYDMSRSKEFVDRSLQVTQKIGIDTTPKEEKVTSRIQSLKQRKKAIEDDLLKQNQLLQERELKVLLSFQRNRQIN